MKLFDFDPYKSTINIRFAAEYQPTWASYKIQARPTNGILYIINGEYQYKFKDGSTAVARQGDLVYLPKGSEKYTYDVRSAVGPQRTAQIEFEVISDGKSLSFANRPQIYSGINKTEAEEAIKGIISTFTSSKPSSIFLAVSNSYRLLAEFESDVEIAGATTSAKSIAPAVSYLEQHYAERIDSKMLAELCHISPSQLRRNFNEVFGCPPMQYKRNLIFKVSKRLLRTGDFKIGEIANMLGFNDIYEFSHFFMKMAGISPSEYQSGDK